MIASPTSFGPLALQFKASRQPMLWAAGAYSLGIVAGVYAWRPAVWWVVAVAVFGAAAANFGSRRSGVAWLLALGTFFLAGALHIQNAIRITPARHGHSALRRSPGNSDHRTCHAGRSDPARGIWGTAADSRPRKRAGPDARWADRPDPFGHSRKHLYPARE